MNIHLHGFNLLEFLARTPLFSVLPGDELERVANSCRLRSFNKGDDVFRVGAPCEAFYIVASGQVKLYVLSPSGQEKVIEIFSPGHSFAEAFMFLEKPYIVNAQALTDTVLVEVSKRGIFHEIENEPRFALRMLAGISRRLHALIKDVDSYALRSGMQRLIGYLLRDIEVESQIRGGAHTVALPASKSTIASRLSLTPEYFSRVLHELEANQLIRIDRRNIHIFDVQKLADYGSQ